MSEVFCYGVNENRTKYEVRVEEKRVKKSDILTGKVRIRETRQGYGFRTAAVSCLKIWNVKIKMFTSLC